MEMILNYILLLVSGAACIYCFVLAKRLKRLNDTKDGIGASIVEMSAALSQTQQTLRLARQASVEGIDRLTALIEDAEKKIPELDELMNAIEAISEIAVEDVEKATQRSLNDIDQRTRKAVEITVALESALKAKSRRIPTKSAA